MHVLHSLFYYLVIPLELTERAHVVPPSFFVSLFIIINIVRVDLFRFLFPCIHSLPVLAGLRHRSGVSGALSPRLVKIVYI